jgi:hypothetical protein
MVRGTVLAAILAILLLSGSAQAFEFSLGGEFTRGVGMQNIVIVHQGPFAVHIGGSVDRKDLAGHGMQSAVFGAIGSFLLKYYLPAGSSLPLSAYLGVGFVGAIVDLSARAERETVALGSGAALGQQVAAGIELSAPHRRMALYAGLTYVDMPELPMTFFGQTARVALAHRGWTFHIGARLDFTF